MSPAIGRIAAPADRIRVATPQRTRAFPFIRYEKYVNDAEEFRRVLDFLRLRRLDSVVPTKNGKPFGGNSFDQSTNTPGRVDAAKIDAWRSALQADEIAAIEKTARFGMELLGYEMVGRHPLAVVI